METVLRGLAIYIVLLLIVRLSGRRTLAQMTPFDLVLLLIVAETTQQALLGDDFSIANAVLLIVTLFGIDIAFSHLKTRHAGLGLLIDGTPTVLVSHGKPNEHALKRARMSVDDILEAARVQQGLERLEQVKYAVLEISGEISIVPRD
ncbi:MAG TPA: YetF domain-containing protein [Ensifer sp.]|jgi:uncharacterized membrane protein YcaP (DUF421 family)|uniref:DUF421 domain-containing protein n=1 Tax=Ensifer sp. TaxID=1872086 RepID=UPI002E145C80|nr:YetF domain-containing protein [Ensifer sp.]